MKIAIVGSGISGLSAALILKEKHQVELFEADNRLGGHAHTVEIKDSNDKVVPMDTGFLVFNEPTYPNFIKMLKYLDIEVVDSDMSLSIKTKAGLEWAGTNLRSVFAQKKNLLNFKFIKMLFEIIRFNRAAKENLELSRLNNWTLKELIEFRQCSDAFLNWYLLPMTSAIWSMSSKDCLEFPAETFLQFCINHNLLQVEGRPVWKTIKNGSISYVKKIEDQLPQVHKECAITKIAPVDSKIRLHTSSKFYDFDKVVLATSAPISYQLLSTEFSSWKQVLAKSRTSSNSVVLHKDESVMPSIRQCWSSWNVIGKKSKDDASNVELNYYLNKLQPLQSKNNFFIALNPDLTPKDIQRQFVYNHPIFDAELLNIQKKLSEIQGSDGIFVAGAWTRYGFHEDGILSAVNVAKLLGVEPPWNN